jgi:hypothetical protein
MADTKELTLEELKTKLAATEKALAAQKAVNEKALATGYVIPKGFKRVDFSDGSFTYVSSEKIIAFNADGEEVETTMADIFRGKIDTPNRMGRKVVKVEK